MARENPHYSALEHSRRQDSKSCFWEQRSDGLATRGTRVKAEFSRAVGGGPWGQPLTQGVEEVLPGHAGARNKRASPASGRDIQVGRQAGQQELWGRPWTGVSAREAHTGPGVQPLVLARGGQSPQLGGAGDLSGHRSQALVVGGERRTGLQAQGRASGGNGSAGLCPNLSLALGGHQPPYRLR